MINDIQNFENAARIATADALLVDRASEPHASLLARWFEVVCLALLSGWRGVSLLRHG